MKKYVKPELFYERFELTEHIADCAWELALANTTDCAANPDKDQIPGAPTLFTVLGTCQMTPDTAEEYCYQPSASGNVFKS